MQKTIISPIKWVGKYFFVIANILLICIYLAEFQIAPFVFVLSDNAFSFGLILLAIYSAATAILTFIKPQACSKIFLSVAAIFFWVLIVFYAGYHKPGLVSSAKCNGTTYYITIHPNSPITVDWYHYRLTKQDGFFKYNSSFYAMAATDLYKIICDQKSNQVMIFELPNHIDYTEGAEMHYYDTGYEKVSINDKTYELAWYDANEIRRYVIVECANEAVESCQLIPVEHFTPVAQDEKGHFVVDQSTNELHIQLDGKIYSIPIQ
jgi:hypothetical protein